MRITQIVAVSENNVIGKDNKLLWHLSRDLKRFKHLTMNNCIVMGRKTFESIGKPLHGRSNIILTRNEEYKQEGCAIHNSLYGLTNTLKYFKEDIDLFIIGGAEIYAQTLDITDRIYLTRVHKEFEGDVSYPLLRKSEWQETSRERFSADENNEFDYSFIEYNRIK